LPAHPVTADARSPKATRIRKVCTKRGSPNATGQRSVRIKRGVAPEESAQRGTSGAANGGGGRSAPDPAHDTINEPHGSLNPAHVIYGMALLDDEGRVIHRDHFFLVVQRLVDVIHQLSLELLFANRIKQIS
jgi:hypothetical protein